MQTTCDKCKKSIKEVGRLNKMSHRGVTQKVCKFCRKKMKLSYG